MPTKKKYKKTRWFSEEALQIDEKGEEKGKKRRKRYTQVNAEFQRIARRDKKAFLSEQCKETEENNRMRKTRNLFKKIRDTKGTFHAKMGTIKDRKCKELTEAEEIKTRKTGQQYIEELYKKHINNQDKDDDVITYLEPDILKCKSQVGLRKHYYEQS